MKGSDKSGPDQLIRSDSVAAGAMLVMRANNHATLDIGLYPNVHYSVVVAKNG